MHKHFDFKMSNEHSSYWQVRATSEGQSFENTVEKLRRKYHRISTSCVIDPHSSGCAGCAGCAGSAGSAGSAGFAGSAGSADCFGCADCAGCVGDAAAGDAGGSFSVD